MTDKPTDEALENLFVEETGFDPDDFPAAIFGFTRAALTKWGQPAQAAEPLRSPCKTCEALARSVMLDQTSFDRKPDCYGIRHITDDDGVEEWEDIRTSQDVAQEEANDMMATGRGELYEVVTLYTTPPAQAVREPLTREQVKAICVESGYETATLQERADFINGIRHAERHHGIKGGQHGTE